MRLIGLLEYSADNVCLGQKSRFNGLHGPPEVMTTDGDVGSLDRSRRTGRIDFEH